MIISDEKQILHKQTFILVKTKTNKHTLETLKKRFQVISLLLIFL